MTTTELARAIKSALRRAAFPFNAMPRAAPLKFKILRVRWKDERKGVVEGARISATRLNADELEQLAHEILRAAVDCRAAASRGR
jgi:hypothetical protein